MRSASCAFLIRSNLHLQNAKKVDLANVVLLHREVVSLFVVVNGCREESFASFEQSLVGESRLDFFKCVKDRRTECCNSGFLVGRGNFDLCF
jgi:hypothetical protein